MSDKQNGTERKIAMLYAISNDGTKIAYEKTSSGKPLLIIGGALSDHHNYSALAERLVDQFEVYNVDRRGRGESTDTKPYSVEKEVEDISAILTSIVEPATLYSHSSGSALALQVAASMRNIANLVIADPPFTAHSQDDYKSKEDFKKETEVIQSFHDQGDDKAAAAFFLSGFGMSTEETNGLLHSPVGEKMIAYAPTLLYDYKLLGDGMVPVELAAKVNVPTLILSAKNTPEAAYELAESLPHSHLQLMESSVHELDPMRVAEAIIQFIK